MAGHRPPVDFDLVRRSNHYLVAAIGVGTDRSHRPVMMSARGRLGPVCRHGGREGRWVGGARQVLLLHRFPFCSTYVAAQNSFASWASADMSIGLLDFLLGVANRDGETAAAPGQRGRTGKI